MRAMDLKMIESTAFKDGQQCHVGSAKLQTVQDYKKKKIKKNRQRMK